MDCAEPSPVPAPRSALVDFHTDRMPASTDLLRSHLPHSVARPVAALSIQVVTDGNEQPLHAHRKAQLLLTLSGVITLETERGVWIAPPQCAVWIPGELPHKASGAGKVLGYGLFVEPDAVPGLPTVCCSVSVSPLLQALIARAAEMPELYDEQGPDGRAIAVLLDELVKAPLEELHLPRPADARLRRLTEALLAEPADPATLECWATRIGMSERSLSRLFRQETGMSVGHWRRQLHVITGTRLLTGGLSVQAVAFDLGYDSPSAFVTMFKKAVGKPPGRFLAERRQVLAQQAGERAG